MQPFGRGGARAWAPVQPTKLAKPAMPLPTVLPTREVVDAAVRAPVPLPAKRAAGTVTPGPSLYPSAPAPAPKRAASTASNTAAPASAYPEDQPAAKRSKVGYQEKPGAVVQGAGVHRARQQQAPPHGASFQAQPTLERAARPADRQRGAPLPAKGASLPAGYPVPSLLPELRQGGQQQSAEYRYRVLEYRARDGLRAADERKAYQAAQAGRAAVLYAPGTSRPQNRAFTLLQQDAILNGYRMPDRIAPIYRAAAAYGSAHPTAVPSPVVSPVVSPVISPEISPAERPLPAAKMNQPRTTKPKKKPAVAPRGGVGGGDGASKAAPIDLETGEGGKEGRRSEGELDKMMHEQLARLRSSWYSSKVGAESLIWGIRS